MEFPKLVLLGATLMFLWKFKKPWELVIVLGATVVGLVVYPLVPP